MRNENEKEKEKAKWRETHYQLADTNGKLIINLRDVGHMMRGLYEGRGSQQRVLIVLNEMGGSVTQRMLTERLQIQSGSASEVIGKLESAGYIVRTVSEADRRNVEVTLTEKGREAAEEAKRKRQLRHEEMFLCLSETEKEELLVLLEKLSSDWEKRFPSAGARLEHAHHGRNHEHDEHHGQNLELEHHGGDFEFEHHGRDGHHEPHRHGEFRRKPE